MKTTRNVLIIIAAVCVAAGIIIFAGALAATGFGLKDLPTDDYEKETHSVTEDFNSVEVKAVDADIIFMPADGDTAKVECLSGERVSYSVEVINKTLTIIRHDKARWWEHIGFFIIAPGYDVKVYLPLEDYKALKVISVSGSISIDEGLSFGDVDLKTVSGDIRSAAGVSGDFKASTTSGEVRVRNISGGKFTFSAASGDLGLTEAAFSEIELLSVSGDMKLEAVTAEGSLQIKTTSGDIEFRDCDGGDISIKTVSGDVEGNLLTGKDFDVNTVSGNVKVPHDPDADQRCRINTTSGDIEIKVK